MKERFKREKTIKHIKWKGGERVGSKVDGGMKKGGEIEKEVMMEKREMRERE